MTRRVFISYSHKDDRYRSELEICLHDLKNRNIIDIWTDRRIEPGQVWSKEVDDNLDNATIFIPLISRDFLASQYCQKELQRALQRHDTQEVTVVPIIIRDCPWQNSPISKMQVLPPHGKAIKTWKDKDEAWTKVTLGLSSICDKRLENKSFLSSKVQPNFGKNVQNSIEKIIQAECRNHDFTIGVFGMTGVGVSSLCNFLVGNDVSRVNDVASTTTKVEVYSINVQNRRVAILCCPGLGESPELDEIYEALYRRLLKEIEMSIWIIRADNVRVLSTELRFIRGPLEPFVREPRNFLLAMNMVDRVDPIGNWDNKNARPGDNQMVNIERRIFYVAERLGIESKLIVPVSVFEEYNLDQIMLKISAAVASPR